VSKEGWKKALEHLAVGYAQAVCRYGMTVGKPSRRCSFAKLRLLSLKAPAVRRERKKRDSAGACRLTICFSFGANSDVSWKHGLGANYDCIRI